jgi:hypothetical protein
MVSGNKFRVAGFQWLHPNASDFFVHVSAKADTGRVHTDASGGEHHLLKLAKRKNWICL